MSALWRINLRVHSLVTLASMGLPLSQAERELQFAEAVVVARFSDPLLRRRKRLELLVHR